MMDTFAQVLDEVFWCLKASGSMMALLQLEKIKDLVYEYEESLKAALIPKECVLV